MAKAEAAGTKPLSKSEVAATLAETVGITKKQAVHFLAAQAELASQQADLLDTAAKKVLKFRVAKAAKDAILGPKK